MKKGALIAVLSVSLLANVGLVYKFILSGSTTEVVDQRTAILLEDGEREIVLGEMRTFLSATQRMAQGISEEDMKAVAEAARSVGQAAAQGVPGSLMGKLPMEFKKLGMATHGGFDQIAMDAESLGDPAHALEQLSGLLNNCVSCHAAYQIRPAALPRP
jgi:hypothetical protein